MGAREWYFFSLRDRKYPTGLRTNRATGSGYWKATGKDRSVYSSSGRNGALLGMKKTLVFYKGRAPRGEKTKWVMHEYRLDGDFSCRHTCKEEWVICRIFHKMGEKKNGVVLLQGQSSSSYMQEGSSSSPTINSLPSLLESNPKTGLLELKSKNHSPDQMNQNQESDLKSLINNNSSVGLTAVSQAYPININGYSYYGLKEQEAATVIKQCKTEPNLSQFQFSDANNILRWPTADSNKMYYPNPVLSFGPMDTSPDVSLMASGAFLSTAAADGTTSVVHDMSTSLSSSEVLTLNMAAGFQQMMVDPAAIKIAAVEYWPFHF